MRHVLLDYTLTSVGKVNGKTEPQLPRVNRIMGHGEIVAAEEALVEMTPDDKEPRLFYLCVYVGGGEKKIPYVDWICTLHVKLHRCRLIGETFIFCVIITVNANLHSQHLEGFKFNEHIAVKSESRQWQYICVGSGLICEGVVPVPDAETKFLLKSQ